MTEQRMLYTSDRGDTFDIVTMETSHLINVIGHHFNQQNTLEAVHNFHPHPTLLVRIQVLTEVVDVLVEELISREVDEEQYLSVQESND